MRGEAIELTMNLLLIKPSSLLCDGMIELLRRQFSNGEINHCDQTEDEILKEHGRRSDIIVIDISMKIPIQPLIRYYQSKGKQVIAWVEDLEDPNLNEVFELGLSGYLYYDINEQMLTEAIKSVQSRKRFIHPLLADRLLDTYVQTQSKEKSPPIGLLSYREWEVLQLLVKGLSNVQIANELYLSDKTVKNYVSTILHKLNVPDRTNAVLYALKKKWIHL